MGSRRNHVKSAYYYENGIHQTNSGKPIDDFEYFAINETAIEKKLRDLHPQEQITKEIRLGFLLKAITLIDLTTLGADDTKSNVSRLCQRTVRPIPADLCKLLGFDYEEPNCPIHTAAVCVYPSKAQIAYDALKLCQREQVIKVAAVATGFPSGQYSLASRLDEITHAINCYASEIDVVIDRSLVLTGQWNKLYDEIRKMKNMCDGAAHLKVILGTGELGSLTNVYKASMVAMLAGADFIKTSTGKETENATLPVGLVMARAIADYHRRYGVKVGLKPAGGIRTAAEAIAWMVMVKDTLGRAWLEPRLFRFGASGLLDDIQNEITKTLMSF